MGSQGSEIVDRASFSEAAEPGRVGAVELQPSGSWW